MAEVVIRRNGRPPRRVDNRIPREADDSDCAEAQEQVGASRYVFPCPAYLLLEFDDLADDWEVVEPDVLNVEIVMSSGFLGDFEKAESHTVGAAPARRAQVVIRRPKDRHGRPTVEQRLRGADLRPPRVLRS